MGFLNDYFRRSNQNIFIQMFFFSKNLRIKVQEINIKLKYFLWNYSKSNFKLQHFTPLCNKINLWIQVHYRNKHYYKKSMNWLITICSLNKNLCSSYFQRDIFLLCLKLCKLFLYTHFWCTSLKGIFFKYFLHVCSKYTDKDI